MKSIYRFIRTNGRFTIIVALFAVAAVVGSSRNVFSAGSYDIALNGGTVIDPETGLNGIWNVGIIGTRIAVISANEISARREVDVTGLVVSPGFIDLHSHGQNAESNRLQALDGVTTALDLEVGAYPLTEWYESRRPSAVINFGVSVAHAGIRIKILHLIDVGHLPSNELSQFAGIKAIFRAALNPERLAEMRRLTESELDAGGLGIGIAAQYIPGMTDDENSAMFEIAGKRHSTIFIHAAFAGVQPPNTGFSAIEKLIALANTHSAGLHIAHVTGIAFGDTPAAVRIITEARGRNPNISTEAYPYRAVGTSISSAYFDPGWQERYGISYNDITVTATGQSLTAETFDDARRDGGMVTVNAIPERAVETAFRDTSIAVASDGLPYINGKAHPRAAGTFSRVLGKFVRDHEWLTLEQAIAKMTLVPAEIAARVSSQMKRKGRLQVGADADITVFNPQTIMDRATYAEPMTASQGVEYVIVNGKFVIDEAKFLEDIFPGEPI